MYCYTYDEFSLTFLCVLLCVTTVGKLKTSIDWHGVAESFECFSDGDNSTERFAKNDRKRRFPTNSKMFNYTQLQVHGRLPRLLSTVLFEEGKTNVFPNPSHVEKNFCAVLYYYYYHYLLNVSTGPFRPKLIYGYRVAYATGTTCHSVFSRRPFDVFKSSSATFVPPPLYLLLSVCPALIPLKPDGPWELSYNVQ